MLAPICQGKSFSGCMKFLFVVNTLSLGKQKWDRGHLRRACAESTLASKICELNFLSNALNFCFNDSE